MKKLIITLLSGVMLLGLSIVSFANGGTPTPEAAPAPHHLTGWMIRLRGIVIDPSVKTTPLPWIGGHVTKVSTEVVPELDFSYFFTRNIAAELILATAKHDVRASGTAVDTNGSLDLGSVWILPPTLTFQYHLFPDSMFSPYIGAGINYTHFFNVKPGTVAREITYTDSFGPALQAGVDIFLNQNWLINFDVKKIYLDTTATVSANALNKVPMKTALGGVRTISTIVKINPWVWGGGIGYKF